MKTTFLQIKTLTLYECFILITTSLLVVFSPSLSFELVNLYDDKRICELALLIISLIGLCLNKNLRHNVIEAFFLFSFRSRYLFFILGLLAVLSSMFAALTNYALLELSLYTSLFLLALIIADINLRDQALFQIYFIVTIIISSFFCQTSFFSAYLASLMNDSPIQGDDLFMGFLNVRFFNYYQGWTFFIIPLPVFLYPRLSLHLHRLLIVLSSGWIVLLLTSNSRAAVLSLIAGLIITGLIFKQLAIPFLKRIASICLYGSIAFIILFYCIPLLLGISTLQLRSIESLTMTMDRITLWKMALDYIARNPLLGIGPMHYAYYSDTFASPHNSLLQWASEMGLPSALILIILIANGLWSWVKLFNNRSKSQAITSTEQQLWIALFCTMCTGLIHSLFGGVTLTPISQILMIVIAGWMFGLYFHSANKIKIVVDTTKNISTMVLAGVTLVVLIYTILPSFVQKFDKLNEDVHTINTKAMYPRFWLQGKIPN